MPPFFWASAMVCSASVVLPDEFRPVDFHHPAARQAADAERDVEPERAGGNGLDIHGLVVLAEPHDRALAELALDLAQRGGKGFRFVHGRSFDETQGRLTHDVALLMAGIRPPDNAALAAPPESTEGKQCTLFVLCSQYVLFVDFANFGHPATVSGTNSAPPRSRTGSARVSPATGGYSA